MNRTLNTPPNAYIAHYSQLDELSGQFKYPVQLYCTKLQSKGVSGQLWIYPNRDKKHEYLPDVIYPSIKQAAENGSCQYYQLHHHYGMENGELWGYIAKYAPKETALTPA